MIVVKRNGRKVAFEVERIKASIKRAATNGRANKDDKSAERFVDRVLPDILGAIDALGLDEMNVEDIQDVVVYEVLEANKTIGLDYAQFRTKRSIERLKASADIERGVHKLLEKDPEIANENANKDSDIYNTQRDLTAGIVGKTLGIKMLPKHVAQAHVSGDIHVHDLDYNPYTPMTNCCLIDFKGMFENGFKIGNAEVESPKSIQTAAAQTAQIIANVASSQYGGCSFNRIDEVLAPYAKLNYRKHLREGAKYGVADFQTYAWDKTRKDILDAMQSLEYEINTLFTSNGQTPFTSLGFGLGAGRFEREIQRAILQIRLEGLGSEKRTAIFPKLIFTLKRGLNLDESDPNYDIKQLALECASKRMYPDVLSYDKIVELTGSFKVPMGCRSFLQGWQDENGEDVVDGRMNLGVVTLNLPRIAMESKGDLKKFFELLDQRLQVSKDALVYRAQRCKQAQPKNAPILFQHGAFGKRLDVNDSVNDLFKNRRATISLGYIGLYETASVFYGGEWENDCEAKDFTLSVLELMKKQTADWSDEYGYHFSVYSTPSESLTDRFCRLDTEKFGVVENVTDKEYYTNSFHYDVRKNPTPFEKLDFEKDYPVFASGGFIHYCEYPIMHHNLKALESVWNYAYDKVGYLGTNTPIDECFCCGYKGEFLPTERGFKCPECQNSDPQKCDVCRRTCGYLGNPQQRPMAKGRHKEISARVKHIEGSVREND